MIRNTCLMPPSPGQRVKDIVHTVRAQIWRTGLSLALLISFAPCAWAEDGAATALPDPLGSPRWTLLKARFFAAAAVVFDGNVLVQAPEFAENPLSVPVSVDASALRDVEEVMVIADFNPIARIIRFEPGRARAFLGFRVKLQESTPIRAAARTRDGLWHVGGTRVTTIGGGCTRPSAGSGSADWLEQLNRVSARLWSNRGQEQRLRFQVIHPMDTGLAPGIPAFYLDSLEVSDRQGRVLMRIQPFEPVAENPLFTIRLPEDDEVAQPLRIGGRDTGGNLVQAEVAE